jgi:hypothetical protein
VNLSRKACDDDRGNVLKGKALFAFDRFAGQLAVAAAERCLWRIDADDVEAHVAQKEKPSIVGNEGEVKMKRRAAVARP